MSLLRWKNAITSAPVLNNLIKFPSGSASTIWMSPSAVEVVLIDSVSSVRALFAEREDLFLPDWPDSPNTGDTGGEMFSLTKNGKKIVLYKTGPNKSRFLLDHECCLHYHSSSNYLSLGVGWSVDNSHQSCLYLLSSPSSSFLYADNSASRASFTPIKSS